MSGLLDQLDRKRVPQVRSSSCKSSVAVTAERLQHQASQNVSCPQSAECSVGHEAAIICQVERHLPGQRLANQACHFDLDMLSDGQSIEFVQYQCDAISTSCASDQSCSGVLHRLQLEQ